MIKTMSIDNLCQPIAGLMTYPISLPNSPGDPKYQIYSSSLGNLHWIERFRQRNHGISMELTGAGGDVDAEKAKFKALAETLERYSCIVYDNRQFIWASGAELGNDALDLDLIPVISDAEAVHPKCPIKKPDKQAKIRWVKGMSLTHKRETWVPSIMTYLYIPAAESERFWLPISTGCAIHTSYEEALLNAIQEVIERDSIALTWLHRLDLPKLHIETSELPEWAIDYHLRTKEHPFIETHYFDATTDLGIPSIYSVQFAPHNDKVATVVMCTTELDPMIAYTKITREAASLRIALQHKDTPNKEIDHFIDVMDGATYMGVKERMHEFDFLVKSTRVQKFSNMKNLSTGDAKKDLEFLINHLKEKGHEIFAVDITSDEALRCGFRAVRVVIPTLQPLSFAYRARFLGSKRLYEAPVKMGYGMKTEADINPIPQPFA